jgi:EAL domain-containing protein (putative c-di-GMP-specific phosphodiesterase class I)
MEWGAAESVSSATAVIDAELPRMVVAKAMKLRNLLREGAVSPLFQPIVGLREGELLGYEALGCGGYEGLPRGIQDLFELAGLIGAELELTQLLRRTSLDECGVFPGSPRFFLNTHPKELRDASLLESLREAREDHPGLRMALEVHESAVTDPTSIGRLKNELEKLDILLVYDDFGAGQARLLELADVPPDYLKFDRSLIRDIDQATTGRRRLLASLAELAADLGIGLIAEGLEKRSEAEICRSLGFGYGQGYLFGRPLSSDHFRSGFHVEEVDPASDTDPG